MRGVAAPPAEAAFPGENGKILYVQGFQSIRTINPDGTGVTTVTGPSVPGGGVDAAAWSPSGTMIVFECGGMICKVDADGSNHEFWYDNGMTMPALDWAPDESRFSLIAYSEDFDHPYLFWATTGPSPWDGMGLAADASAGAPWSPDGSRIAFRSGWPTTDAGIKTIAPDGSGQTTVPNTGIAKAGFGDIDWSPDAQRLVFEGEQAGMRGLFTIRLDGSDLTRITSAPSGSRDFHPAWAPDGSKIAFVRGVYPDTGLFVVDADGGTPTALTAAGSNVWSPDWQPIPVNAYPRPKAATPTEIALVPAYEQCTAPNRTHGPPLAFGSCAPPVRTPGELTVGTPDSNGRPVKMVSKLWLRVRPGIPSTPADEADVRLFGTVNDVRLASDLSDYTGALEARVTLRITDKDNNPHPGGPGAATTQVVPYSFPIPCAATADTTIGAECTFDTTAEAFVPGIAKEGRRAIWELGQLAVHDGTGSVFMRQGVFVP